MTGAQPINNEGAQPQARQEEVDSGLINGREDLAEQHVHHALAFWNDDVDAQHARQRRGHRHQGPGKDE